MGSCLSVNSSSDRSVAGQQGEVRSSADYRNHYLDIKSGRDQVTCNNAGSDTVQSLSGIHQEQQCIVTNKGEKHRSSSGDRGFDHSSADSVTGTTGGSSSVFKGLLVRAESLKKSTIINSIVSNSIIGSSGLSNVENNNSILMTSYAPSQNSQNLESLYTQYSNGLGSIEAAGCSRLCTDLNLSPDSFQILLLAFRMGCVVMCSISRSEFMRGLTYFSTESINGLKLGLVNLEVRVNGEPELFKEVYRWAYGYGLEPGEKNLQLDMAVLLWKCVFGTSNYKDRVGEWLEYLEVDRGGHGNWITRDTWNMFLVFVTSVSMDLSNYNEEEAWPTLFDDFVEYELRRRKTAEPSASATTMSQSQDPADQVLLQ